MRGLALFISVAFAVAGYRPAIAADPVDPPVSGWIFSSWGDDDYCDYFSWKAFVYTDPITGKPATFGFGWHPWGISQINPQVPIYTGPIFIGLETGGSPGPATTMTLNTDDPPSTPPTMTGDPPGQSNKPPDPPKAPDPGTDVVPVVGDLGGPVTSPDAPPPKPDPSGAPIGIRVTGSDSGQTYAFRGPEHAVPGSGPGKLDGGHDVGFAGCTTGADKTCGFTVAHNQLSGYGLATFSQAGAHQMLNLVASGYPTAPASDDACRSKQRSGGREANAI